MHFSSSLSWFHYSACYYLQCSSSLSQRIKRRVKTLVFCQNLFQLGAWGVAALLWGRDFSFFSFLFGCNISNISLFLLWFWITKMPNNSDQGHLWRESTVNIRSACAEYHILCEHIASVGQKLYHHQDWELHVLCFTGINDWLIELSFWAFFPNKFPILYNSRKKWNKSNQCDNAGSGYESNECNQCD